MGEEGRPTAAASCLRELGAFVYIDIYKIIVIVILALFKYAFRSSIALKIGIPSVSKVY